MRHQHLYDVLSLAIPTKRKRKRNEVDDEVDDEPCEDNDPGRFRIERRCSGKLDPVSADLIEAGICAGKTCWDYDSYVASVRSGAGIRGDELFIDPLTREWIDIKQLQNARPENARTTAEATVAPVPTDERLDPGFQFNVDETTRRQLEEQPLSEEDRRLYPELDTSSGEDIDFSESDSDDSEEEFLNERNRVEGQIVISEELLRKRFVPPAWDSFGSTHLEFLRMYVGALMTVTFASTQHRGLFPNWHPMEPYRRSSSLNKYEVIGVSINATDEFHIVPIVEFKTMVHVLNRLLQLYGLTKYEVGNPETKPFIPQPRFLSLNAPFNERVDKKYFDKLYKALNTLRIKTIQVKSRLWKIAAAASSKDEEGRRIATLRFTLRFYTNPTVMLKDNFLLQGYIGQVERLEDHVTLQGAYTEDAFLEHWVAEHCMHSHDETRSCVKAYTRSHPLPYTQSVPYAQTCASVPLPLRLALLDLKLGINTGPNWRDTVTKLNSSYRSQQEPTKSKMREHKKKKKGKKRQTARIELPEHKGERAREHQAVTDRFKALLQDRKRLVYEALLHQLRTLDYDEDRTLYDVVYSDEVPIPDKKAILRFVCGDWRRWTLPTPDGEVYYPMINPYDYGICEMSMKGNKIRINKPS